jgi:hypothetical protein
MKRAEREVLKEKLVKLQKEWMCIKQATGDATDQRAEIKISVKGRRNARKTG